ncbi:MAG TPA: hypothetical protein VFM82_07220 [Flavobacteriaceae bacterium]|nr:hypothetical protein [Flavobacteriaceae bacterium]
MNLNRQLINVLIVIVGAGMLIYDLAVEGENIYVKIIGLVLLMYGLYTATQQWTAGNNNQEEDSEFDDEDEKFQ